MIDDHAAVAIIGVAVRLEDAPDIESFWRQSLHGRSAGSVGASGAFDGDRSGVEALVDDALRDAGIAPPGADGDPRDSSDAGHGATVDPESSSEAGDGADVDPGSPAGTRPGVDVCMLEVDADCGPKDAFGEHFTRCVGSIADGREAVILCGVAGGSHGAALVLRRLGDAQRCGERVYATIEPATSDREAVEMPQLVCVAGDRAPKPPPADAPFPIVAVASFARRWRLIGPLAEAVELAGCCLALQQGIIPPCDDEELSSERLFAAPSARPWFRGGFSDRRRALVCGAEPDGMSLSLSLEPAAAASWVELDSAWSTELVLVSAQTRSDLSVAIEQLLGNVRNYPSLSLRDLAARLAEQPARRFRLAIVAASTGELADKLEELARAVPRTQRQRRNGIYFGDADAFCGHGTAFVFPGNGSQYAGMLADLCRRLPAVRSWFDDLDRSWGGAPAMAPTGLIFPAQPRTEEHKELIRNALTSYECGLQANFLGSMALHDLLDATGVRPDAAVGYSSGENAALIAASVLRFEDRHDLFDLMRDLRLDVGADGGGGRLRRGVSVAITGARREELDAVLDRHGDDLFLTLDNCPSQVVLFGREETVDAAVERLRERGAIAIRLPFDRPYHTPWCAAESAALRRVYDALEVRAPDRPVYSCVTGEPFPLEPDAIRELATSLWSRPVRFRQTIEAMWEAGVRTFVEVGAGGRLKGYIDDTLRGKEHTAVATDVENRPGETQLQHAIGALFARGANIDTVPLYRHRRAGSVQIPWQLDGGQRRGDAGGSAPANVERPEGVRDFEEVDREAPADRSGGARVAHGTGSGDPRSAGAGELGEAERMHILTEQMELLDRFLEQQSRAWDAFFGTANEPVRRAGGSAPGTEARDIVRPGPMLGEIVEHGTERLVCRRRLSVETDPYLADHGLGHRGGPCSRGVALKILPFAFSMETAAEAADLLGGEGLTPVALENVRGHRWIALEDDEVTIEIVAEWGPDRDAIEVAIHELAQPGDGQRLLAVEATVRVADRLPDPPAAMKVPIEPGRQSLWDARDYFDRCLFHGPAFRAMKEITGVGKGCLEVEMEVPEWVTPLREHRDRAVLMPNLTDSIGQIDSYELVENDVQHFALFPFLLERLSWYRRPPRAGARWRALLTRQQHDDATSTAHCDFVDEAGRVAIRFEAFRSAFRPMPHEFMALIVRPGPHTFLSSPQLAGFQGASVRFIDPAQHEYVHFSGGIWLRALVHMYLDRADRRRWYALPASSPERMALLTARIAAVEAVKATAWSHHGMALDPGDVEIEDDGDETGQTRCRVRVADGDDLLRSVCLARAGDCVVAAAAAEADSRVGVSLAMAGADEQAALCDLLSADETARLERLDACGPAALWCACEATVKAVGCSLARTERVWKLVGSAPDRLELAVGDTVVRVIVHQEDSRVLAVCVVSEHTARAVRERVVNGVETGRS